MAKILIRTDKCRLSLLYKNRNFIKEKTCMTINIYITKRRS